MRKVVYRYRQDALLDPILFLEEGWKLVVPEEERDRVLEHAHHDLSS